MRVRPDLAERNRRECKHGMNRTATHNSWCSMRQRCLDTGSKDYARYGGRGIAIDPRWDDFSAFLADMGERPEGTTLGRIDNEKGYSPENCRWEAARQQASNRRSTRLITHNGESKTIAEWARILGVPRQTIRYRLEAGWSIADIVTSQPDRTTKRKPTNGN